MTEHRIPLSLYAKRDVLSAKTAILKYCKSKGIPESDVIEFYKDNYSGGIVIKVKDLGGFEYE